MGSWDDGLQRVQTADGYARGKLCGGYVKFAGAIGPETEQREIKGGGARLEFKC